VLHYTAKQLELEMKKLLALVLLFSSVNVYSANLHRYDVYVMIKNSATSYHTEVMAENLYWAQQIATTQCGGPDVCQVTARQID